MNNFASWLHQNWGIEHYIQERLLYSILCFLLLYLLKHLTLFIVFRKTTDIKNRYFWKNAIRNFYYSITLILISFIWIEHFGNIGTFLGLFSAGLAIALQDPIVDLAGWIFILARRPFEVGDRIEIGNFAGDVVDIRFFQFTINEINNWVDADQSTGRIIHVPNNTIFKHPLANYNQGFTHIWNEIHVLITFESNWEKGQNILNTIVNKHAEKISQEAKENLIEASKKYMILYSKLTPIVYLSVKEYGIQLTMRFLCLPRKRRVTEHKIWKDVLTSFKETHDIQLAYPTNKIFIDHQSNEHPKSNLPPMGSSSK